MGDSIGDGDAGEASAIEECSVINTGDDKVHASMGHYGGDGKAASRSIRSIMPISIIRDAPRKIHVGIRAGDTHLSGYRVGGDGVVQRLPRGRNGTEVVVLGEGGLGPCGEGVYAQHKQKYYFLHVFYGFLFAPRPEVAVYSAIRKVKPPIPPHK